MPNWVLNKVYFYGNKDRIAELRRFMTSPDHAFDFNKIKPMPAELNMDSGSSEEFAIRCANVYRETKCEESEEYKKDIFWYHEKSFMEWVELGNRYISNKEKYGNTTWYGWCCNNWGTKWNSCDACWESDDMVTFNTAWSAPVPIFDHLRKLFPDVAFSVDYADEDFGNNCGRISWDQDSDFHVEEINSYEFACEVFGYDPYEEEKEVESYAEF